LIASSAGIEGDRTPLCPSCGIPRLGDAVGGRGEDRAAIERGPTAGDAFDQ
jgi:hypothetical protein